MGGQGQQLSRQFQQLNLMTPSQLGEAELLPGPPLSPVPQSPEPWDALPSTLPSPLPSALSPLSPSSCEGGVGSALLASSSSPLPYSLSTESATGVGTMSSSNFSEYLCGPLPSSSLTPLASSSSSSSHQCPLPSSQGMIHPSPFSPLPSSHTPHSLSLPYASSTSNNNNNNNNNNSNNNNNHIQPELSQMVHLTSHPSLDPPLEYSPPSYPPSSPPSLSQQAIPSLHPSVTPSLVPSITPSLAPPPVTSSVQQEGGMLVNNLNGFPANSDSITQHNIYTNCQSDMVCPGQSSEGKKGIVRRSGVTLVTHPFSSSDIDIQSEENMDFDL